jgi:hypothetical protein
LLPKSWERTKRFLVREGRMDSRRAREWSELYRSNFTDPDLPDPDAAAPKEKWIRANERIQRVDAEVRAALNDVAIPEGL